MIQAAPGTKAYLACCTMVSHAWQLSFGRIWRMSLKLLGTYSSTSRSSWPTRLNTVPPQPGQGAARLMGDGLARQVRRQRLAHRLAAPARAGLARAVGAGGLGTGGALGRLLLQFADQQFELLDVAAK